MTKTTYKWKFKEGDTVEVNDRGRKYVRTLVRTVNDCGGWLLNEGIPKNDPSPLRMWNEDCMTLVKKA